MLDGVRILWWKMTEKEEILKSHDVNFWVNKWDTKDTPWHQTTVNPRLVKYIGLLDGGKKNVKILVPLCGKTVDMKWLSEQGHRVVGVEASPLAIEEFFKEHSLEYRTEMRNAIPVYLENSGRIIIYCCDIYDFHRTGEGSFDAVWDRGSLGAINPGDRTRYLDLMSSLKTANSAHLIEIYDYDNSVYQDFPFSIPMSKLVELFGERYDAKLIETQDYPEFGQMRQIDFKWFNRNLFLVTLK